jgi:hypothetical protein
MPTEKIIAEVLKCLNACKETDREAQRHAKGNRNTFWNFQLRKHQILQKYFIYV